MGHIKMVTRRKCPVNVALARAFPGNWRVVGGTLSESIISSRDEQNGSMILQAHEWGKIRGV